MLNTHTRIRGHVVHPHSKFLLILVLATGLIHTAVLLIAPAYTPLASNLIQLLASLLTAVVCLFQATKANGAVVQRRAWYQLAFAFTVWSAGQGVFCINLLSSTSTPSPNLSDAAWLAFAFPLLMVAARRDSISDIVGWLDTAQSGAFFVILFVLAYHRPAAISMVTAYNVQSIAMILACTLRYSTSQADEDRVFFRNLSLYALAYGTFSAIGYAGPRFGFAPGSIVDICWSLPFLIFSVVTLVRQPSRPANRESSARDSARHHLQGISAFGLAGMSMYAAVTLARNSSVGGGIAVTVTLLLFAVRTLAREWQLRKAQEKLRHASFHDLLTGLPNRAYLEQRLTRHFASIGEEANDRMVILLIDLDRFKMLNEGWGRSIGNDVLSTIAARIRHVIRSQDLLVRYGGDEFAILLMEIEKREAEAILRRIIEAIRLPLLIDGKSLYVTASAGLACAAADSDAEAIMRDADCAMYKAKLAGKNRFEEFAVSMRDASTRKLRIEMALRGAIAAEALTVHYQPIYSMPEARVCGFEALVRWTDQALGSVSPAEFIPVAEDMGLIIPLGQFVLRSACAQVARWNREYDSELFISVNLSPRQFDAPDLLATVERCLVEAELLPQLLKLEITESVLLDGQKTVSAFLSQARSAGIQISLDDFGTGYSSLTYLLRYECDVIKIDQSFVRNLDQDSVRGELVRTIVHLAHNLGKQVVAEGVELQGELAFLNEVRCHMVQGYLLSKPLPVPMVEALLSKSTTMATESSRSQLTRSIVPVA